jgi:Mo-dependent nitrogenase C-terminus
MSALNQSSFESQALNLIRHWLDTIEVDNPKVARLFCTIIPTQCPFERNVKLFNHVIFHIPPLCHFNPLYEQLAALRFRSLCYLADICGEDITPYCR